MPLPDPNQLPEYFKRYSWNKYHIAFGYPPDDYQNGFPWIRNLEARFTQSNWNTDASVRIISEMIFWGGNQNDVLKNFCKKIGSVTNLNNLVRKITLTLNDCNTALESALSMPGLGLSYATKLLRFLNPNTYGALDSRIIDAMGGDLPRVHPYLKSRQKGYCRFIEMLEDYRHKLAHRNIQRPAYGPLQATNHWKAAEIEMALFAWAS